MILSELRNRTSNLCSEKQNCKSFVCGNNVVDQIKKTGMFYQIVSNRRKMFHYYTLHSVIHQILIHTQHSLLQINLVKWYTFESVHQKINNVGFRSCLIQTGLYSHRNRLEAWNFGYKQWRNCSIRVAKTKVLSSFAITAKLMCTFVFDFADCWFSHAQALFLLAA